MDPLSQVFEGKGGTGLAVILDEPGLDPAKIHMNRINELKKKKINDQKALTSALEGISEFDDTGWYVHQAEIQQGRKDLVKFYVDNFKKGVNPDSPTQNLDTYMQAQRMKDDLKSRAAYSKQLKDHYKTQRGRMEGKQGDFTPESIERFKNYYRDPLSTQMLSLPPELVEAGEVYDYLKYIDSQAKGTAYTQYTAKKEGRTTFSKRAKEASVKQRISDILSSEQGKFAIKDKMENEGMTEPQAIQWVKDRFNSSLGTIFKDIEDEDKAGWNITIRPGGFGMASKNFRFELSEKEEGMAHDPLNPLKTIQKIRIARNDASENKPIFVAGEYVLPLGFEEKEGEWFMTGKNEAGDDVEIPEIEARADIQANYDGFTVDELLKQREAQTKGAGYGGAPEGKGRGY